MNKLEESPVSSRLQWVTQKALTECNNNQSELARKLGVSDATIRHWRDGDVGSPRADTRPIIARLAKQYAGKAIATSSELMAWLYPSDGGDLDAAKIEHLETLLGDCYASIEAARQEFEYLKLNYPGGQGMCSSLVDYFRRALTDLGYEFPRDRTKFMKKAQWNAEIADRMIAIANNEAIAAFDDMPAIARTLRLLSEGEINITDFVNYCSSC